MIGTKKLGLALSGGGYRATAYHIGTLKKLKELGILENIDVISCISGGSILGAYYGLHKGDFDDFEKKAKNAVGKNVVLALFTSVWLYLILVVLVFTGYIAIQLHTLIFIVWLLILFKFQFKLFPLSKLVIKAYNKFFFEGKTLNDLPQNPIIAINATNIESGRPFTFSRVKMSDSFYEYPQDNGEKILFKNSEYPISNAVAASTCVPFVFTPISIEKRYYYKETDYKRVNPLLIDGGIYDNQGIHKLNQKGSIYYCDFAIISDAGNDIFNTKHIRNQSSLLIASFDLLMNRIRNKQMIDSIYKENKEDKRVAYQSLQWRVENSIDGFYSNLMKNYIPQGVWLKHGITEEDISQHRREKIIEKLKNSISYKSILDNAPTDGEYQTAFNVSTNLWSLKVNQIDALIKCASSITEIQVRLYYPDLLIN